MSSSMIWISDHLIWLLAAGWAIAALLVALAARSLWRWFRRRRSGERPRWIVLALALPAVLVAGFGLLFTTLGLKEMGPGLLAQHRMLGEPAPAVAWERLDGTGSATLADLRGKVVLVNVWATWCLPCRAEMPELDRLQRDLGDRGFVVLFLSDEDVSTLAAFVGENPTSALHGRADPLPFPETGRPTTYLLDRDGVIRKILLGPRSYEQFHSLVTHHL